MWRLNAMCRIVAAMRSLHCTLTTALISSPFLSFPLFSSLLFYTTLLCNTRFTTNLFCSNLLYSALLYVTLYCTSLLCTALISTALCYSHISLHDTVQLMTFNSTLFCRIYSSKVLYSKQFCSALLLISLI